MLKSLSLLAPTFSLAIVAPLAAQAVDDKAVEYLRHEGLENSQVMEHLSWMCDVYGPRLTGSKNLERAQKWALDTFTSWGLQNPHMEEWGPFGNGWQLNHFSMHVTGENPWPVHAWPKAWSPGVDGRVEGEVVLAYEMTADELEAADLSGKIVFTQNMRGVGEPFEGPAQRFDDSEMLAKANSSPAPRRTARRNRRAGNFRRGFARQQQMMEIIGRKKPLALVDRGSKGDYGTIFVSSASVIRPEGYEGGRLRAQDPKNGIVLPQFTLSVEHYNRIYRMTQKGVTVRIALEMDASFYTDDPMERNVLAEIAGTDPQIGDQVVMLGAHFDSWHSGTGATDNGAGSAVMMEATRLIAEMVRATGTAPRRTIRVALWSGEEQGLLGSRAYVREHFGTADKPTAEHAKLAGYFNMDNGTGKVRGVYLQGNGAVGAIFRRWLAPFHDLGAATLTLDNTGGTDHLAFDGVGLPGFQVIQDPVAYSTQTHHSNMDNWDHAIAEDLQQAATVIASLVWHTAQRDEVLPRKEVPASGTR